MSSSGENNLDSECYAARHKGTPEAAGSLDEFHTATYGDVVVAWGFFTEDFKHHGRDPEVVKVRFSSTMMRGDDGRLKMIPAHRDIQPFGADGRYIQRGE